MAAEKMARERDRLNFLEELHTARTIGIEVEASVLLEHSRVVLDEEAVRDRLCCDNHRRSNNNHNNNGSVGDGPREEADPDNNQESPSRRPRDKNPSACSSNGGDQGRRWVLHVCRELRRNRFAAQRAVMRQNVVPVLTLPLAEGRAGAAARVGTRDSSFSPPPPKTTTTDDTRGRTNSEARSRNMTSPKSARALKDGRKRRVESGRRRSQRGWGHSYNYDHS